MRWTSASVQESRCEDDACTVVAKVGYLIGGLVILERLFNYPGMGRLIFTAANQKDFPLLEASVLIVGIIFLISTLIADLLYSILNPRIRFATAE